ncbi:MAG: DUF732 domain-containing protein [Mycobacterium sp.]
MTKHGSITAAVAACVTAVVAVVGAAGARADPAADYGHAHAAEICRALDEAPTADTVMEQGLDAVQSGLTTRQAGNALVAAVNDQCPQHLPLLVAVARS